MQLAVIDKLIVPGSLTNINLMLLLEHENLMDHSASGMGHRTVVRETGSGFRGIAGRPRSSGEVGRKPIFQV